MQSGITPLFSSAFFLLSSRSPDRWDMKTNPRNLLFRVTDVSLLALNTTKDTHRPHPELHLAQPRRNQRAPVFALNLNDLPVPAPRAVCISATAEPMRSGRTSYNNPFHFASHITRETVQRLRSDISFTDGPTRRTSSDPKDRIQGRT